MPAKEQVPVRSTERAHRRAPFEFLEELPDEVARVWGQAWPLVPWVLRRPLRRLSQVPATWAPNVDIYEQDTHLVVKVDLPGVHKEDIDITLEDGDLVLRGERRAESGVPDEAYHRAERPMGPFHRRLPLPFEASPEHIRASFSDGVLEISIRRPAERRRPQRIDIA